MSIFFAAFAAMLGSMAAVVAAPTIFVIAIGAAKALGLLLLVAIVAAVVWVSRQ